MTLFVNVFDCAVVLALGLALAIGRGREGDRGVRIPSDRSQLQHHRLADGTSAGDGARLGIAYRLSTGDVVFVREGN